MADYANTQMSLTEQGIHAVNSHGVKTISDETASSESSATPVGRDHLAGVLPPHESYEGIHRWDPGAIWTPAEEARVVWITDLKLLSWVCLMFLCLQLDRGNLSNALTDVSQHQFITLVLWYTSERFQIPHPAH